MKKTSEWSPAIIRTESEMCFLAIDLVYVGFTECPRLFSSHSREGIIAEQSYFTI